MKLKKRLALLLVAVMITTLMPTISFAEDMAASDSSNATPVFTDMPNNWSTAALQNAVDNGLLKGDNGRLRPGDNLTRAEMASIINRAFGAIEKANLTGYRDVSEKTWYYEEMGKALQMDTFQGGGDGLLRPKDSITRQEVFVVMARAFKLNNDSDANINGFADQASISSWAKPAAVALVDAGYIQGSNGRLNPKENITRAELAKLMDSMLTGYINSPGTVDEVTGGNIMINVPGVTLKNLAVKGDLIIGDGVGEGNVSLENVTIAGRLVVRGGGANSILITGNSNMESIIIAKVNGKVRVFTTDGTEIGEVLADGSDDVILEGNFSSIIVQSNNIVVNAVKAKIGEVSIEGNNSTLLVGSGSTLETVRVTGNNVTIEGVGSVDAVQVYSANVVVKTMNTAVSAETGSTGVDAAGTSVNAGNTVITRPKTSSGGSGGSSTPPPPPSDFAGGLGTEASPYQVATADQLNKVRNHLDKHFIQTADIDLGVAPWNQGAGWVPIGTYSEAFSGSYDGGYYSISNLTISNSALSYAGLFGHLSGEIAGVAISGGSIRALDFSGLLAGYVTGTVRESSAVGVVNAHEHVGVLVGHNRGLIEECFARGEITGNNIVGGFVGWNDGNPVVGKPYQGIIRNSYSLVSSTGNYNTGGLVGVNQNNGLIEKSYSSGPVTGEGGLVGQNVVGGTVTNSYYDSVTSGKNDSDRGTPLATGQMTQQASFSGWDYTSIWGINPSVNSGYPFLRWEGHIAGAGTVLDPYQVASKEHLDLIRNNMSAHYKQIADIDLETITNWVPIGYNAVNPNSPQMFSGSFDGSNYKISNLSTDFHADGNNNVGLFASSNGATFKNMDLQDVNVHGYMLVGSIVGHLYLSTMENCSANGTVRGEFHTIGGLAGYNHNGTMRMNGFGGSVYAGYGMVGGLTGRTYEALVEDCYSTATVMNLEHYDAGGLVGSHESDSIIRRSYSTGNVTGDLESGGLVGRSYSGIGAISESYATGNISGLSAVGGLIGNNHTGSIISNSYSTGTVTGNNNVGGFAGENIGTIQNSYSRGWINSSGLNKGGFIGINTNTLTWGIVDSCYYDSYIALLSDSGKGEPKTTAQLNNQSTYVGWDFTNIWSLGDNYPILRWQPDR